MAKKKKYIIRYWTNVDKIGEYIVNEDQVDLGNGRNNLKQFIRPQKGTHWTTVKNSEKLRFRTIELYDKKSNIISKNRTFHK
jgi:hypothetical protein